MEESHKTDMLSTVDSMSHNGRKHKTDMLSTVDSTSHSGRKHKPDNYTIYGR